MQSPTPAPNALFVKAWQHMHLYAGDSPRTQDAVSDTAEEVWVWANGSYPDTIPEEHHANAVRCIENYWHRAVKNVIADMYKADALLEYGVDVSDIPLDLRTRSAADVAIYWSNVLQRAADLDRIRPRTVSRQALIDQLWRGAYQSRIETYQPDTSPAHLSVFHPDRLDVILVNAEPVLRAHGLELEGGFVRAGRGGLPAPQHSSSRASIQLWTELSAACGEHPFLIYAVLADTGTLHLGVSWATLCATLLAYEHGGPTSAVDVRGWADALRQVAEAVQYAYDIPARIWTDPVGRGGSICQSLQPAPVRP